MNNKQKSSNTTELNTVPSNINHMELKSIKELLKKEKDLEKGENICVLTPIGWKIKTDLNEL